MPDTLVTIGRSWQKSQPWFRFCWIKIVIGDFLEKMWWLSKSICHAQAENILKLVCNSMCDLLQLWCCRAMLSLSAWVFASMLASCAKGEQSFAFSRSRFASFGFTFGRAFVFTRFCIIFSGLPVRMVKIGWCHQLQQKISNRSR